VPCSRTLRLATNGESGDRTHNLVVAGRPSYPTELQPPLKKGVNIIRQSPEEGGTEDDDELRPLCWREDDVTQRKGASSG